MSRAEADVNYGEHPGPGEFKKCVVTQLPHS